MEPPYLENIERAHSRWPRVLWKILFYRGRFRRVRTYRDIYRKAGV